ncbi:MAG: hypothetical protein FWE20_04980 [Defluviitaleaceae bacterium]|nr:hypothetical protein [Defluviitaleaceae bacterium]
MLSILTQPSFASVETITYDLLGRKSDLYVVNTPRHTAATPDRINQMIASIEDNTRQIYTLAKEKSKIAEKIAANLDFLRLSKKYLSREQIGSFVSFSGISEKNSHTLKQVLQEIDTLKSLDAVKRELLHTNTDLDLVYGELEAILDLQRSALRCFEDVLISGRELMQLL